MKSLNAYRGTTISELEAFLIVVDKLIDKRIKENPASGLIVSKGKPNEIRIKYKELKRISNSLQSYLGIKGTMSFGICKNCTKFNGNVSGSKEFGVCGNTTVHEYDTCSNHSKKGGGYGL